MKNRILVSCFLCVLVVLVSLKSGAQNVIWQENFNYSDFTTSGTGTPSGVTLWTTDGYEAWGRERHAGIYVENNQIRATENIGNSRDIWQISPGYPINVNGYAAVTISIDFSSRSFPNWGGETPSIVAEYQVDGGAWTSFPGTPITGAISGTQTVTSPKFSGRSLYVKFTMRSYDGASSSSYYADNIVVRGTAPDAPPDCSTLLEPANGSIDIALDQTTLRWNTASMATGYSFYLGTDNPPTNVVSGSNTTATNYHLSSNFSANTTYYWQVVPYNDYSSAEGCPVWSFTTGNTGESNTQINQPFNKGQPLVFEFQFNDCAIISDGTLVVDVQGDIDQHWLNEYYIITDEAGNQVGEIGKTGNGWNDDRCDYASKTFTIDMADLQSYASDNVITFVAYPQSDVDDLPNCDDYVNMSLGYSYSGEPNCLISGNSEANVNETGLVFSAPDNLTSYSWTISDGDAVIDGLTTSQSVTVNAVSSDFTINLDIEGYPGCINSCSKSVAVSAAALPSVSVNVNPVSVDENAGTGMSYTFTRSGSATDPLTINFTVGGTANATDYFQSGADAFEVTSGSITFMAGNSTAIITVTPIDETTYESDETVILTVISGTGYNVGAPSSATGTIVNDDSLPSVSFSSDSKSSINESGTLEITVQLSTISALDVNVYFTINASSTASENIDYTMSSSPLVISAGESSGNIILTIVNDYYAEPDETVVIEMSPPGNATQGEITTQTATITNDDEASVGDNSNCTDITTTLNTGNVIPWDGSTSVMLGDGDVLYIQDGQDFTGDINGSAESIICVGEDAHFHPNAYNFTGIMRNYSINGDSIVFYNPINGGKIENYGGIISFKTSNFNNSTIFVNCSGQMYFRNSSNFNLNSASSIYNSGTIVVAAGELQGNGSIINDGWMTIQSYVASNDFYNNGKVELLGNKLHFNGGVVVNNCSFFSNVNGSSFQNNTNIDNNGLIYFPEGTFENKGSNIFVNGETGVVLVKNLTNEGTVTGSGNFYVSEYSQNINNGFFGESGDAINFYDASNATGGFDNQNATVGDAVYYDPFPEPQYSPNLSEYECGDVISNNGYTVNPGQIAQNDTICYGLSVGLTNEIVASTEKTSSISYQWQSCTDSINFENITGATAEDYTTETLIETTYFRRVAKADFGDDIYNNSAISNVVKITVRSASDFFITIIPPTYDSEQVSCLPEMSSYNDFQSAGGSVINVCTTVNTSSFEISDSYNYQEGVSSPEVIRTYSIQDEDGNTYTETQTFQLNDTEAPVIDCGPDILVAPANNDCSATLTFTPAITENCKFVEDSAEVTLSPAIPFNLNPTTLEVEADFPLGTTTITWRVSDECGNVGTCSKQVTVEFSLTAITYDGTYNETDDGPGMNPLQTSTHTYQVDGGISESGYTYDWELEDGSGNVVTSGYSINGDGTASISITYNTDTDTLSTGNYILSIRKSKNTTICEQSQTLAISVLSNGGFDVSIEDLSDQQCQTPSSTTTTYIWQITFQDESGINQPFQFDYAVQLEGSTMQSGTVGPFSLSGEWSLKPPASGDFPLVQTRKVANSSIIELVFTFANAPDLDRNIQVVIQNTKGAYSVSEPDVTNNTDAVKASKIPTISFE